MTITDSDYTDNLICFLQIYLAKLNSYCIALEQTAGGIGLHIKANKTEYMYFKQEGAISTVRPLKLIDKFTYLGCSISSFGLAKA